ncbi:hypothetical protein A2U01_0068622, partial [Trifolium medium]|nr:hypothetical protein [Trifolium medium]
MLQVPATKPAKPARRITLISSFIASTPSIIEATVIKPSLAPNMAALSNCALS